MRASLSHSFRAAAVALVLAAAGCSSSSSSNPDSFVGTWAFQSGAIMPNCTLVMLDPVDLKGSTVNITKVDATHVAMMISGGGATCNVRFAVDGTTAKADSGQTCDIVDNGIQATVAVSSWSLSLANGQIDMLMTGSTSVMYGGFTISCMPSSTGTLIHASPDAAQGG